MKTDVPEGTFSGEIIGAPRWDFPMRSWSSSTKKFGDIGIQEANHVAAMDVPSMANEFV